MEIVQADLLDTPSIMRALRRSVPDEVYNLASVSLRPGLVDEPVQTAEFTAVGATALLEAIRGSTPVSASTRRTSSEIFGDPADVPQTEETPLATVTPYGVAKAYAHFITRSYRHRYGMYACSGILYNHESPRRPLDFVTRKVSHGAASIALGLERELRLGALDARRDWGYAGDYVRAMCAMLRQDKTWGLRNRLRHAHSVQEVVEVAFDHLSLDWREFVRADDALYRGRAELHDLVGDSTKARTQLRLGADGQLRVPRPHARRRGPRGARRHETRCRPPFAPRRAMTATPVDDADVDALVARLKAELATSGDGRDGASSWHGARVAANRLANVSGDRPFFRHRRALWAPAELRGAPVKAVVRKLVRWYVEPIAAEQRAFNAAALELVDARRGRGTTPAPPRTASASTAPALGAQVDEPAAGRCDEHGRRLTELDERFVRTERRPAGAPASGRAAPRTAGRRRASSCARARRPAADRLLRLREPHARRPRRDPAARQAHYVEDFPRRGAGPRRRLRPRRVPRASARGRRRGARHRRRRATWSAFCRGEGLDVEQADALAYLAGVRAGLARRHLLRARGRAPAAGRARPLPRAGRAGRSAPTASSLLETPNPVVARRPRALLRRPHPRAPLVPETLAFLVRQAGLTVEGDRYRNEPPTRRSGCGRCPCPPARLRSRPGRALAENTARLNEVVFGPQDYAVSSHRR